jgi:hypothetical protein
MTSRRRFLRLLSAPIWQCALSATVVALARAADLPELELPNPSFPDFAPELRRKFEALGFDIESAYKCFFYTKEAFLSKSPNRLSLVLGPEFKIHRAEDPEIVIRGHDARGLARFGPLLFSDRVLEMVRPQDFGALVMSSSGLAFGRGEIWMQPACANAACTEMRFETTIFNEYLGQR